MGSSPAGTQESIKFGKDFEVDLRSFELRHGGRALKLERLPLQVLVILIEQKGQLVTREEIAEKIWGKDVFVDTDNSINGAVRKIRQALKDDPQQPRYVETLSGRGYRFIAPVSDAGHMPAPLQLVAKPQPSHTDSAPARPLVEPTSNQPDLPPASITPARRRFPLWIAIISCCAIALGAWFAWQHFYGKGATQSIHSIAVIPLQNLSGDPAQDFFADGMTEELITELSRIDSLRVISHTSVMEYRGTRKHLPQIASELGVDAILEGSVIRENNNVRVTVQLLDGPADRHLWGEEYERPLNGILNLQRDVAQAIAQEVRAKLSTTQQARLREAHVVNPASYDAYLKGRFYFDNGFTKPDSLKKGRQYFEESIQKDPNFAQAYAGLANTYLYLAFTGVLPKDEAYQSAKKLLAKAVELDDGVGEAHDTLGVLKSEFEWDWEAADREYNRAIALAPSYSCAHESRAGFLALFDRRDEALAELAKIDQLDAGVGSADSEVGVFYLLRDYPSLINASNRALLLDPNQWFLHYNLGVGYEGTGKLQEAISEYKKVVEMSDDPKGSVALAHAYSAVGKKAEGEQILRDLERKLKGTADSPLTMAGIYASLGENDKALEFLEKANSEKSLNLPQSLKSDLVFDSLHSDPRFQDLAHRVGIPQ
ncbi:winged helix-turn-helix domain-containing protein [Telmatobacter sp. DSM 110680]|uniref:Winged helix-turn-helix domain-containing protein n=1 Tax=Telmatobacter sp. DSM 110680 TaxID=3036704 RepID=A0AAU7DHX7_9BACT